ncbi:MAG: TetR/AcrR family transcriptional regulator [Oscillospiraceae bacterium]|jgi:AcrR family transcriptional regulator|nr:TetR/AcrR family transcriptional regulator [Oscillospiraceae bacterium]
MNNTREQILLAALKLFAKDGYEAVSMRNIAGRLGITQGALYKHYTNKRAIFDAILERMEEKDMARAKAFNVPEGRFSEMSGKYRNATLEAVKQFTVAQYIYWTQDEFASDFREMLTLEQYRNSEMAALYQQYFAYGVIAYLEDLFREMTQFNECGLKNPKLLALQFFAPVYMMMYMDGMENQETASALIEKHVDYFMNTIKNGRKAP